MQTEQWSKMNLLVLPYKYFEPEIRNVTQIDRICLLVILPFSIFICKISIKAGVLITFQVFLDRFIEREIQSMLVHCVHHDQGCDWKDELKKREVYRGGSRLFNCCH